MGFFTVVLLAALGCSLVTSKPLEASGGSSFSFGLTGNTNFGGLATGLAQKFKAENDKIKNVGGQIAAHADGAFKEGIQVATDNVKIQTTGHGNYGGVEESHGGNKGGAQAQFSFSSDKTVSKQQAAGAIAGHGEFLSQTSGTFQTGGHETVAANNAGYSSQLSFVSVGGKVTTQTAGAAEAHAKHESQASAGAVDGGYNSQSGYAVNAGANLGSSDGKEAGTRIEIDLLGAGKHVAEKADAFKTAVQENVHAVHEVVKEHTDKISNTGKLTVQTAGAGEAHLNYDANNYGSQASAGAANGGYALNAGANFEENYSSGSSHGQVVNNKQEFGVKIDGSKVLDGLLGAGKHLAETADAHKTAVQGKVQSFNDNVKAHINKNTYSGQFTTQQTPNAGEAQLNFEVSQASAGNGGFNSQQSGYAVNAGANFEENYSSGSSHGQVANNKQEFGVKIDGSKVVDGFLGAGKHVAETADSLKTAVQGKVQSFNDNLKAHITKNTNSAGQFPAQQTPNAGEAQLNFEVSQASAGNGGFNSQQSGYASNGQEVHLNVHQGGVREDVNAFQNDVKVGANKVLNTLGSIISNSVKHATETAAAFNTGGSHGAEGHYGANTGGVKLAFSASVNKQKEGGSDAQAGSSLSNLFGNKFL